MQELEIVSLVHGGEGLARLGGKAVFVPYTAPGERVRIGIEEERRDYSRGKLVEILAPSPHRVEPFCPHFGFCGGCQWQHLAHSEQLLWKKEILGEALTRIGGLAQAPIQPTLGMEEPWGYRGSVRLGLTREGKPGLKAWHTHHIVPLQDCPILIPPLRELLLALEIDFPGLKGLSLRGSAHTGERLVLLELDADEPPFLEVTLPCSCVAQLPDGTQLTLVGNDFYTEELGGRPFRISAGSFFQANTLQAERLAAMLMAHLELRGDERVLDAYSGVGTFGLLLAPQVARVVGIEAHPQASADARFNAQAQGIENAEFHQGTVEDLAPSLGETFDLVLLDPPRQGCSPQAREALIALSPRAIAYISCDPATLARDLKGLTAAGYGLEAIWPIDMFPQTYHIESVAWLRR